MLQLNEPYVMTRITATQVSKLFIKLTSCTDLKASPTCKTIIATQRGGHTCRGNIGRGDVYSLHVRSHDKV